MTAPRQPRGASLPPAEMRLRRDALDMVDAALQAVDPDRLVAEALEREKPSPPEGGRLWLVAVGKAAVPMAAGALRVLGDAVTDGWVLAPDGAGDGPPGLHLLHGAHPLPEDRNVGGARTLHEVARRAGPRDWILLLLSGGGSALLTLPDGDVSLADLRATTDLLLRAGATIQELNAVRKHLEVLKGGGLARVAVPARIMALVLSDVVGDPLDVIGSGPVSPDPSTFDEAIEVLEAHGLWNAVPGPVREHLLWGRGGEVAETPKAGDPVFGGVHVRVVGSAVRAAAAAAERARELGYRSHVLDTEVTGEAREVGRRLARVAREVSGTGSPVEPPAAVVAAGETTVTVLGDGVGGRNQEVALAAARDLEDRVDALVLSMGTDGVDGPTDAAGAFATGSTMRRARSAGLDPAGALARNDAYPFFETLGDLVVTGPTGTNVMDLMLVLVGRPAGS
ncbi:MAG: glycerate kinase [Gemmatimonadetes bacterium]|nr:glycerate kinase [Gemmatimonadota bacterium]